MLHTITITITTPLSLSISICREHSHSSAFLAFFLSRHSMRPGMCLVYMHTSCIRQECSCIIMQELLSPLRPSPLPVHPVSAGFVFRSPARQTHSHTTNSPLSPDPRKTQTHVYISCTPSSQPSLPTRLRHTTPDTSARSSFSFSSPHSFQNDLDSLIYSIPPSIPAPSRIPDLDVPDTSFIAYHSTA